MELGPELQKLRVDRRYLGARDVTGLVDAAIAALLASKPDDPQEYLAKNLARLEAERALRRRPRPLCSGEVEPGTEPGGMEGTTIADRRRWLREARHAFERETAVVTQEADRMAHVAADAPAEKRKSVACADSLIAHDMVLARKRRKEDQDKAWGRYTARAVHACSFAEDETVPEEVLALWTHKRRATAKSTPSHTPSR
eukprot:Hpha_TRINITY_DN15404_c0_g2::TRINITY_DN15404_c0_g2_i1::g.173209::m.173209